LLLLGWSCDMKDLQSSSNILISNTLIVIHVYFMCYVCTSYIAFIAYEFATYII
jgi:hypothetical protein